MTMDEVIAVHIRHFEEVSNNMKIKLDDMQFFYRGLRYVSLCFEQRAKSYQTMVNAEE
jgi:hypothetical protein